MHVAAAAQPVLRKVPMRSSKGNGPYADAPDAADEAGDWPAEGVSSEQTAQAHELA